MQHARRRTISCFSTIGVMLMVVSAGSAQADLPLNGYVRAGRCMPVKVDGSIRQLLLDGAVPTHVAAGVTGIVPVLILVDTPGMLRAGSTEFPLRPLLPDQRLVGVAGGDSTIGSLLYPDQTVLTVPLDAARPLPGPLIAWETLDAVILDAAPENIGELLATGITVAVRSQRKPDERWPWQRVADAWVIRATLAGPTGSIGGDVAYLPTHSWSPGRPEGLRRQIVLAAVLVSLLLMSAMLIRGKRAILAMVAITIICSGGIEAWRRSVPTLAAVGGAIVVQSDQMTQRDQWTYFAAGSSGGSGTTTLDRPVLASASHAALIGLRLECDPVNGVLWRFDLPPKARVATRLRMVAPRLDLPVMEKPVTSPLYDLARQGYLGSQSRIAGQFTGQTWPSVVVERE